MYKYSTEIITAPRDTHLFGDHKSVATEFDAAVFLSGFHRKETISLLSCLKPTVIQELVDVVRDASQNPGKQPPPVSLIALVGPHERTVIKSTFCSDDPVDAIEKYYSLNISTRSDSVFLNAEFPPKS